MDKACAVSVLIPVYNAGKYLRKCIDSVLNQSFCDFELILCDDCSMDNSKEICDEYCERDERVRVIHKKTNEGNYAARRTLLENAKGKYILFVDADDWIRPETIQQTVDFAEARNVDVVMFGHQIVSDRESFISDRCHLFLDQCVLLGDDLKSVYMKFVSSNQMNYLWDKLIRKECFASDNQDVETLRRNFAGSDKLMMTSVLRNIVSFSYLDVPLYFYRMSSSGMGRNFRKEKLQDLIYVGNTVKSFMREKLSGEPQVMALYNANIAKSITDLVISAVHCRKYSKYELIEYFNEIRKTELYLAISATGIKTNGSMLKRVVRFMFKRKMDNSLILFLKIEGWSRTAINGLLK